MKNGDFLYSLYIDDEKLKPEIIKYKITTINKNGIYFTIFDETSWINKKAIGKRFSKIEEWGWDKNIPSYYKRHCKNKDELEGLGFYKTKIKAVKHKSFKRRFNEDEIKTIERKIQNLIKTMKDKKNV